MDDGSAAAPLLERLDDEIATFGRSGGPAEWGGRIVPPAETVARVRRHFPALGITRVGRLTGLDRLGVPVWFATRPNGWTLSVSQGKGADDAAAQASAIMEAAELSVAERAPVAARRAARRDLLEQGASVFAAERYLRRGAARPDATAPIDWIEAVDLVARRPVWVPLAAASLRPVPPGAADSVFRQSTNGLASGNALIEAINHAIWELVERDATALASLIPEPALAARRLDPRADPQLAPVARRIEQAGLRLALFDITTDLGIPTHQAVITPAEGRIEGWTLFDVAAGSGAHPSPRRAALRAVTEAAQTRLTNIAGARDDIEPADYAAPLPRALPRSMLAPGAEPGLPLDEGAMAATPVTGPATPSALLDWTLARLRAAGIGQVVAVDLGGQEQGVRVAKLLVPDLEDDPRSPHRRPGPRALRAMFGLR